MCGLMYICPNYIHTNKYVRTENLAILAHCIVLHSIYNTIHIIVQ